MKTRLFVLLLLLTGVVSATYASTSAFFTVTLASVSAANLNFSSNPVTPGSSVDVSLTLQNTGGSAATVFPTAFVYSGNTLVNVISFTPTSVGVNSVVVLTKTFSTSGLSAGNYTFIGNTTYDGNGTNVSSSSFTNYLIINAAAGSQPTGGGGGGDVIITPITPKELPKEIIPVLERDGLSLTKSLPLKEVVSGINRLESFAIKNTGSQQREISVSLTGLPDEWFSLSPSKTVLQPGEERTVNVLFKVPEFALPGDYLLEVEAGSSVVKDFIVLRVKQPVKNRPMVTRDIKIDWESKESVVSFEVNNLAEKSFPTLLLFEDVPYGLKDSKISFLDKPGLIEESKIKWVLTDVLPGEVQTVSYKIDSASKDYSSYSNWPVEQVSVERKTTFEELIRVSDFLVPTSEPGETVEVTAKVFYTGLDPLEAVFSLNVPSDFKVEPQQTKINLIPRGISSLSFKVKVPENADGSFAVSLDVWTRLGQLEKNSIILVSKPQQGTSYNVLADAAIVLLVLLVVYFVFIRIKDKISGLSHVKERETLLGEVKHIIRKDKID